MAVIAAIADDLTGATTVGVLLARAGVTTAAVFDRDNLAHEDAGFDHHAIIVSTDSRALPKEEAMYRVRTTAAALKKLGVRYFSKRTDTTLRGGIGAEIDAMLEALGTDAVAVMVPAMPQSNRIVVGGYSIINGIPLSKTPVANDVRTPVRDSYVPRLIGSQTKHQVGYICLDEIIKGRENLKSALESSRNSGARILIVDAISLEDVEMIAQAVVELDWNVLAVDPGPFTERLAKVRGFINDEVRNTVPLGMGLDNYSGTVLVVAGSASPVTRVQMGVLKEASKASQISVKAPSLLKGGETSNSEIERVSKEVISLLSSDSTPKVILLETALTGEVLNLSEEEGKHGLKAGEAADNINMGLGKIVHQVLEKIPDKVVGLYMTGGDIMVNVCASLCVKGIELKDYVIPQADLGRLIGSKFSGLPVIGKGGLTGDNYTAVHCVNRLFVEGSNNK